MQKKEEQLLLLWWHLQQIQWPRFTHSLLEKKSEVRRILVRRSEVDSRYDTRLWFPERERTLIRKWALSLLHRLDLIRVSQSKDFAFSNPRQEGSRKKICFRINWSRRRDLFPLGNEKDHLSKNEIRRVHSVRALGLSLKEKEAGNSTIAKSKES